VRSFGLSLVLLAGCPWEDDTPAADIDTGTAPPSESSSGEPVDPGPDTATITHAFGETMLAGFEEQERCVSWTPANDEAMYVQAVTLANLSGFHHSNWFVVPDDVYEGEDGWWDCNERGYEDVAAATAGTVLFAQSTQSWLETQALGDGVVVKIPPRSRIVGSIHLLNLSSQPVATDLWLTLDLLHPRLVSTVVTPMRFSFLDLRIEPLGETRHTADCSIGPVLAAADPLGPSLRVHYALPHFHALGNYFSVAEVGSPPLFELDGFDADANGRVFDPPVQLADPAALRFECGFDNFRSEPVGWGIGDQEMCVMLLLVESNVIIETAVPSSMPVYVEDEITYVTGDCGVLVSPKSPSQGPPTVDEITAPLYVPPVDPEDADIPPVPACVDANVDAEPWEDHSIEALRTGLFGPACTFGACHGAAAAGGLDLTVEDLVPALLEHEPTTSGGIPLVVPGDPAGSWLYRVLSECAPMRADGTIASHMPLNAPVLLDDAAIASVHAWIQDDLQ
jgi:hypothetical protein